MISKRDDKVRGSFTDDELHQSALFETHTPMYTGSHTTGTPVTPPPFWNESRLKMYTGAAFFALAGTLLFVILTSQGADGVSGRLGGDYAAFHGAGLLVYEGRAEDLYDWSAQAEIQAPFFPDEPGKYLKNPYPAFFALPFAALAPLGFQGSFAVYTAFLWLCLWWSARILRPLLVNYGHLTFPLFVAMVFFYPLFRSVLGGQNTALTILLISILIRTQWEQKYWTSGVALGCLFFKPQFALPLFGLLLLRGRWRTLLGASGSVLCLYLIAAMFCGFDWPLMWASQLENFRVTDQALNDWQAVGLLGFFQALLGGQSTIADIMGAGATIAIVGVLATLWLTRWRIGLSKWSITLCALVLMPPHLLFYDAGLLVLPVLFLMESSKNIRWSQTAWLAGFLGLAASYLGANPLSVVAIVLGIGSLRSTGSKQTGVNAA